MNSVLCISEDFGEAKVWFSADLHLGDPRQELLCRPFKNYTECAETLCSNWNRLVRKDDIVIVVGDWCIDEEALKWTKRFQGKKILLRGNYDRLPDQAYTDNGFSRVLTEGEGLVLTLVNEDGEKLEVNVVHYPSLCSPDYFNLCGHIHGTWKVQKNMLNVGVDAHHFFPIDVNKIFFYYNGIKNFYDQDVWIAGHPANVVHSSRGKAGTYFEYKFEGSLK